MAACSPGSTTSASRVRPVSERGSDRISPTAYATGQLWFRHGLSHPGLATARGKRLERGFRVMMYGLKRVSGVSFEALMLARHRGLDAILARAIDEGRVTQVIEIAAGLSARGWRMMQRYGDKLTYIETDLPAMAATKRDLLDRAGISSPRHRVMVLDALKDDGAESLSAIAASLDPTQGLAIITEGLMSYLDPESAASVWQRIARTLSGFRHGTYLADWYLRGDNISLGMLAFRSVLQKFVRGKMYVHFHSAAEAMVVLKAHGFAEVKIHETRSIPETRELAATPGADRVRVLETRTKS
jgi:O-methyltransferase involved in polyketide biosynthesis